MPYAFLWFLVLYIVVAAPLVALLVLVWRGTAAGMGRLALLAVGGVALYVYSFYALLWLPGFIFSWYESGRWPAAPLGQKQYSITIDQLAAIAVRGREIRHATQSERDWWWDLTYRAAAGPETPIGSTWSHSDSLALRVERSDNLLAVLVSDEPVAYVRVPGGRFRSYAFTYPFLSNETYWRNVALAMAVDVSDVVRMQRDLDAAERGASPGASIERLDLAARQIVVRYRWPARLRLATFSIDLGDGRLTLVDLSRRSVPVD